MKPRKETKETTTVQEKVLGTAILVAATALFVAFTVFLGRPLLEMAQNPEAMETFLAEWGALGRLVFIGIQMLQSLLPIPLELTTVVGGYVFGPVEGTLLTVCAVLLSTTLIFHITKRWGAKLLNLFFPPSRQKKLRIFRNPRLRNALTWVMFLIPGTPKRLFVFSAGLVPQSFGRFLLISTAARLPTIVACNFGGHAIGEGKYEQAIIILVILIVLSIVGAFIYWAVSRRKKGRL